MFNPRIYENSEPDGFPVLEIARDLAPDAPGLLPPTQPDPTEAPRRFVPLTRTELAGAVVGPVAALRLTQTFAFPREQCPKVLEAAYRFPLPGDAAVTGVRVRFVEVEIAAEPAERSVA